VSDVRETRPRMEEAFISLVRRIEAEKAMEEREYVEETKG
jgi:hypothetical protein